MFQFLTNFSLMLMAKLEEARGLLLTVMGAADFSLVLCSTTVQTFGNPFAIGGGTLMHMFQLPSKILSIVRIGWRIQSNPRFFSAGVPLRKCLRRYLSM